MHRIPSDTPSSQLSSPPREPPELADPFVLARSMYNGLLVLIQCKKRATAADSRNKQKTSIITRFIGFQLRQHLPARSNVRVGVALPPQKGTVHYFALQKWHSPRFAHFLLMKSELLPYCASSLSGDTIWHG